MADQNQTVQASALTNNQGEFKMFSIIRFSTLVLLISIFCTTFAADGTVKMIYPHSDGGFSFSTHQIKKDGKDVRFLVEKGSNTEKFDMMYLAVMHAQATGYRLWISSSDYIYDQHGAPAGKCYGLSVNK